MTRKTSSAQRQTRGRRRSRATRNPRVPPRRLRIALGADHGGFALKARLVQVLQRGGCEVADLGTHSPKPCDYPAIGFKVASAIARGRFDRGVLLCKSGLGIAMVANKVPGIRAAVCHDLFDAKRSRSHNDANVLVLGAERLRESHAVRILEAWLHTPFESGGRHERRVKQIAALERQLFRSQKTEDRRQKGV